MLKNTDIRQPVEDFLTENKYGFEVEIASDFMIFTITDTLKAAKPVMQLFFRDSSTYEDFDYTQKTDPICLQASETRNYNSDINIYKTGDAVDYVSRRCWRWRLQP